MSEGLILVINERHELARKLIMKGIGNCLCKGSLADYLVHLDAGSIDCFTQ